MDFIILSIPIFFILIGVEVLISKLGQTHLYRFNDAITNISCGIAQQITGVFGKTVMVVGYIFLYENARILNIEDTWSTYLLLFIGVDFCYYWFHRLSHEISLIWGTHIVHHQSEEYNLSVALRQSSFQGFISMLFYLPLALIGFNPVAFVAINAFQTLYQFWIHTRAIKKLPVWFEYLFNTPSHHRVHHGRNPLYIDKNHGGTLIIFDRLFGTFQAETEDVVYGVTKPLASWNPVWANFDWYADLWMDFNKPMRWIDRLRLLFYKPGWLPDYLGGYRAPKEISNNETITYDTHIPKSLNYYILLQYVVLLGLTTAFLFKEASFTRFQQMGIALFIFLSIANIGGIFECKNWAWWLEWFRWLVFIVLFYQIWSKADIPSWILIMGVACILFSTGWFIGFKKIFYPWQIKND